MSLFLIVAQYMDSGVSGKKYLVRIPDWKYLTPGDIVICEKPDDGKEVLYVALTPEFRSDDGILEKWGASNETIRTVVAVLRRDDIEMADDGVMREEPVIDG